MADDNSQSEVTLAGGRSNVSTRNGVIYREGAPWSATVIALLQHLEARGFDYAPRVVGTGFDEQGRETLTYIEGESVHPHAWQDDALPILGRILRNLHRATESFVAPANSVWRPWFGRKLGQPSIIGHCDTGAWNIIARAGKPIGLIDWEAAGPVDPMIELAQACWLNGLLFDDGLGEKLGLGSAEQRARQVALLLDGYELHRAHREGFVDLMRDFAILCAAQEAIDGGVTPETTDATALWGIAWRARSAAWIVKNHNMLNRVVASSS